MIIIISNKGEGGSNLCTPSCSGPPASSNFYTRKIKKKYFTLVVILGHPLAFHH